jgi:hypothetical protein
MNIEGNNQHQAMIEKQSKQHRFSAGSIAQQNVAS